MLEHLRKCLRTSSRRTIRLADDKRVLCRLTEMPGTEVGGAPLNRSVDQPIRADDCGDPILDESVTERHVRVDQIKPGQGRQSGLDRWGLQRDQAEVEPAL